MISSSSQQIVTLVRLTYDIWLGSQIMAPATTSPFIMRYQVHCSPYPPNYYPILFVYCMIHD